MEEHQDFARLVAVDALKVVPGGWEVPDWAEFQESNEAVKDPPREGPDAPPAIRWSKDRITVPPQRKLRQA